MSVGGIFLLIAVVLWFLMGIGVKTIPGVDAFAHMCLGLGLLLGGIPFGPFWRPHP
jgi:hypothetical protein